MPQFDISTYSSQIFWLFFCILFLIFFLKKVLLPRIENIFQTRYYRFSDERKKIMLLQDKIFLLKKNKTEKLEKAQEEVREQIKLLKITLADERELYLEKINNEMQAEILQFQAKLKIKNKETEQVQDVILEEYTTLLKTKLIEPISFKKKA